MTAIRVKFFHNQSSDYQGSCGKTIVAERIIELPDSIELGDVRSEVAAKLKELGYQDDNFAGFGNEYCDFTGRGIISITI